MTSHPNDRTSLQARIARYALLAAIGLPCACVRAPTCPPGSAAWQRSELYMGQLRRDGTSVEEASFRAFVDRVVAPALPLGFTLVPTRGHYRDRSGNVVDEPGRLLIVLHQGDAATARALAKVRSHYRESFDQESVLRTDSQTCASF